MSRLPGFALQVRVRVPGFSTGLLPRRKGIGIRADSPAGLFSTRPPPHTGPWKIKSNKQTARAALLHIASPQVALFLL
ncbi:hypothetical protein DyAD56_01155 [Dyella sp. AD56]|nr:hypothetical protein DyAD56_01155 [Dyella sp. AD56]